MIETGKGMYLGAVCSLGREWDQNTLYGSVKMNAYGVQFNVHQLKKKTAEKRLKEITQGARGVGSSCAKDGVPGKDRAIGRGAEGGAARGRRGSG
jgi:hypothetical protein